jgi:hypothetical protein
MDESHREVTMTYEELKPRIAGITVQSLEGKDVVLKSLWARRRIALVFLRHFG